MALLCPKADWITEPWVGALRPAVTPQFEHASKEVFFTAIGISHRASYLHEDYQNGANLT